MHNAFILGSGRSGTSMVAGTLSKAGYFMGKDFWPTRDANPKGFFEDREINEINEDILAPVIPPRLNFFGKTFFRHRPLKWQRWLAHLPNSVQLQASSEIEQRIQRIVQNEPFCLKDPRFSYTLPIWKPFLKDTIYICVFRDPGSTALSIFKECQQVPHLKDKVKGIKISLHQALKIWTAMYACILKNHYPENQENWLFLHYNQALTEEGLNKLESFTKAPVDRSFPDASIRRSFSTLTIPRKTSQIYQQLCQLANYQETSSVG